MATVHEAALTFDLDDADVAQAVAGALMPELADGPPGSRASLRQDGATLHIKARADDLGAMRALLNNAVRLLDAARRSASDAPQDL